MIDPSKYEGLPSVFGTSQRIAVAEHILQYVVEPPIPFTADEVVKSLRDTIPTSSIGRALRHLEDAGMVTKLQPVSYDRRKHLVCDPKHPFWNVVAAAFEATTDQGQ